MGWNQRSSNSDIFRRCTLGAGAGAGGEIGDAEIRGEAADGEANGAVAEMKDTFMTFLPYMKGPIRLILRAVSGLTNWNSWKNQ